MADGFANEAIARRDRRVYEELKDVPWHIQSAYLLDKASLPAVRGNF